MQNRLAKQESLNRLVGAKESPLAALPIDVMRYGIIPVLKKEWLHSENLFQGVHYNFIGDLWNIGPLLKELIDFLIELGVEPLAGARTGPAEHLANSTEELSIAVYALRRGFESKWGGWSTSTITQVSFLALQIERAVKNLPKFNDSKAEKHLNVLKENFEEFNKKIQDLVDWHKTYFPQEAFGDHMPDPTFSIRVVPDKERVSQCFIKYINYQISLYPESSETTDCLGVMLEDSTRWYPVCKTFTAWTSGYDIYIMEKRGPDDIEPVVVAFLIRRNSDAFAEYLYVLEHFRNWGHATKLVEKAEIRGTYSIKEEMRFWIKYAKNHGLCVSTPTPDGIRVIENCGKSCLACALRKLDQCPPPVTHRSCKRCKYCDFC